MPLREWLKWVRDRAVAPEKRLEEFTGNFTKSVAGGMCSGSRQPSDHEFEFITKNVKEEHPEVEHLIFADLRDEPHLHCEQGPIGIADVSEEEENTDKSGHYDEDDETKLAKSLEADQEIDLYSKNKIPKAAKDVIASKVFKKFEHHWCITGKVETERSVIARLAAKFKGILNISYERFPVVDNHIPSDEVVDRFVNWAMKLPPKTWVHFHCHGGKGRTATFVAMYNLCYFTKNPEVMPHDFDPMASPRLKKDGDVEPEGGRKERIEFMTKFTAYIALVRQNIKEHKDSPSWSEWKATQKDSLTSPLPRRTFSRGGGNDLI